MKRYIYTLTLTDTNGTVVHKEEFESGELILGPKRQQLLKPFQEEADRLGLTLDIQFTELQ